MDFFVIMIAAVTGYLLGSISFARIVRTAVAPGTDISKIVQPLPESDLTFESDSVSATAVRLRIGTRYGCLTGVLDMLKVAIPTLCFRLWYPSAPYFLVVAAMGVVGHNWPVYSGFKGGRGESAIYGGLLIIDPLGVMITNLAGSVVGLLLGNLLVLRWGGLVLMIPWLWYRTADWAHVTYILFVNVVYWTAVFPDLRQYYRLQKQGLSLSQEQLAGLLAMGGRLGRFMDLYSLPALLKRRT
jgi:glycerol-3-phosphate acyltransferase PlsY